MIPVAKPAFGAEEEAAVIRVLRSGWVTQGPEVAAFEKDFAAYVGAPYACAVSNCTTGLHMALLALGVGPGDEVVTVSHSFIATANAVVYCGAVPVFIDIDPATYNIDPSLIEARITERTKAILCVHQIGMPCDLPALKAIADRHGLVLIEDAACAAGSEIEVNGRWEKIGQPHGHVAVFSFHPRKILVTGEGGMLTTADPALDSAFRKLRHHGMSVSDVERHRSKTVTFETYTMVGYNYRMTDLQAAVGREQLRRLPATVARRRELAARYSEILGAIGGFGVPQEPAWARTNWQSYCVRLPEGCDQQAVIQTLLDQGISVRRGIMNAHEEPAYEEAPWKPGPEDRAALAESERAHRQCLILPMPSDMTEADVQTVCDALRAACAL